MNPADFPGGQRNILFCCTRQSALLSPDSNYKPVRQAELWFTQTCVAAKSDHVTRSRAHSFNVFGKIE